METDFTVKDIKHNVIVKFVQSFLPETKKAFNLRAMNQPVLDIHGIASKAAVYNLTTSPKVIEEGLKAGMELMLYLAADGYKIKTPLFNLKMRIPSEYNGSETHLNEGTFPVARLQTSSLFRQYLKEKVNLKFDGIYSVPGRIAEMLDEATGITDNVMTIGNILTIHGTGIKLIGDEAHKSAIGVFFNNKKEPPIKATIIPVNEFRTLKVLIPNELKKGEEYQIAIETMCSGKGNGCMLKQMQNIRSEFTMTAA